MTSEQEKTLPGGKKPALHQRPAAMLLRYLSKWCLGYDLTGLPAHLNSIDTRLNDTRENFDRKSREAAEHKEKYQQFRREQVEKNRKLSEGLEGFRSHLDNLKKRDDALARDLNLLKTLLESVHTNPHVFWLFANRTERMDANLPIYDEARRSFHKARYKFAAEQVSGLKVADIACGPGYGTALLVSEGGAAHATGIDIDKEAIDYASAVYTGEKVDYIAADALNTGLESGAFDAVISFETIEHLPDDAGLVAEFARLLKPGGKLIISTPNQWPLEDAPFHVREYDRAAFEKVLTEHFEINQIFNQNSGTSSRFNRGQPEGIVETTRDNEEFAECYIALCTRR